MGKKWSWFATVKKALTPDRKRGSKLKKTWLTKPKNVGSSKGTDPPPPVDPPLSPPPPPPPPLSKEKVEEEDGDEEESRQAYSVALATAAAAKAAVAAADAAADVVRLTNASRVSGKLKHEIAAIKIQTTFRGYVSRRELRALRGLARLKTLIRGQSVKHQSSTTLLRMQTLARVKSQIRLRRIRMSEENQSRQQQLQQKQEKSVVRDWNLSVKSKAEVEAKQQHRHEAAMRRDRALAYASSHQQSWKNASKSSNPSVNNAHRGWSWLERWMEDRPMSTTDCNKQAPATISKSAAENKRKACPPRPTRPSSIKRKSPRGRGWGDNDSMRRDEKEKRSKKRLSFPPEQTPAEQRRLSGPPKVDLSTIRDKVANGGKPRSN